MLRVVAAPSLRGAGRPDGPGEHPAEACGWTCRAAVDEARLLEELEALAAKNQVFRSFIGHGLLATPSPRRSSCGTSSRTPAGTPSTRPTRPEISQGRLEALLNFQTMVIDLTGLPVANASLLDEGTAAAEAMAMCFQRAWRSPGTTRSSSPTRLPPADDRRGADAGRRARHRGGRRRSPHLRLLARKIFGALVQYPATDGAVDDYRRLRRAGPRRRAACSSWRPRTCSRSPLLTPPGELGADIAVGSAQRFGVPMGYGGPHAAFFATKHEYTRHHAGPDHRRVRGRPGPAARCAWRCRPASSTSAARRPRATSAPRRCCSRSWPACTPSTTGPRG